MFETTGSDKTAVVSLRTKSLPETLAEQIRTAILAGRIQPGERLIELKLAATFGIGQPTVREALKELEFQGFVRKSPNRGTYVTELTHGDMQKMYEVRMALETLAIEKATENVTVADVNALREHLVTLEAASRSGDLAAFHQADIEFHRTIWDMSGNEFLAASLDRIVFVLFAFVILKRHDNPPSYAASVEQHRRMLEAIATGDPVRACKVFDEETNGYWCEYHHIADPE